MIAGDPSQTDLPSRRNSGLKKAIRLLSNINGIKMCRFDKNDVMRHSLVERIVNAYENAEKDERAALNPAITREKE